MKKIITTLLIIALAITSSFAADVQIISKASETSLTAVLQYAGQTLDNEEGLQITTNESLDVATVQKTEDFSILVNSNKTSDTTLIIDINASSFVSKNGFDSEITPKTDSNFNRELIIPSGVHANETASTFNLSWTGKEGLPSGDYSSEVIITISAN